MSESNLIEIEGEIKWFDPRKGYGFIVGPEGQDIFVHFTVIEQEEGFRTFRDGEKVIYDANDGSKGWSATKARALSPRAAEPSITEAKPDSASVTEPSVD
ncbi:MAG: cold shock domain-containing protein [Phycisphaerales bacterium]|jgi:CspA family cold shock protein|nr:cold shock domain-containing protein [Phycisphaerales bacterium]